MERQAFLTAQSSALAKYGVVCEQKFVEIPFLRGRAQVLVAGDGPPVVMLGGIGTPAAMFAPLMARLDGLTLYAVDLPGYGLTDTTPTIATDLKSTAIAFVGQVLDALGLYRPTIIANSLGSNWASWFVLDQPDRISALVHVGCPALILDTSAPLIMRLLATRGLGWLMMRLQPPSARQVRELSEMVREDPLPSEIAALLLATERLPGFEATFRATLNAALGLWGGPPGNGPASRSAGPDRRSFAADLWALGSVRRTGDRPQGCQSASRRRVSHRRWGPCTMVASCRPDSTIDPRLPQPQERQGSASELTPLRRLGIRSFPDVVCEAKDGKAGCDCCFFAVWQRPGLGQF